jgi:hypothetical protein
MKRNLLAAIFFSLIFSVPVFAQSVLYTENFDSYTAGATLGTSNPTWWIPWTGTAGGTDDVKISNEQSNSTPNSIKFYSASTQGDYDMVLKLGDKTFGEYELEFKIYIGTLSTDGAYFNMLHLMPSAAEWAFSILFDTNLDITLSHNNAPLDIGTYTKGVWNTVKVKVNLDKDSAKFIFNGNELASWQWSIQESGGAGVKQLAGADFFTYAGGATGSTVLFYIDDVEYSQEGNIGISQNLPVEWVAAYPNPTDGMIRFLAPGVEEVRVYNLAGSLSGVFPINNGMANLSSLPAGIYMAEAVSGAGMIRTRIVRN